MTRPRTTGNGRGQRTYTRIPVDYTHKLKALDKLAKGAEVGAVIDELYPSISKAERNKKQKQISKWKKQAGFIKKVYDDGKEHLQNFRRSGDATILSADAERDIVLWLNTMRKEGCSVSEKMPELKALEVAADNGISLDVFSASYSWRHRFLRSIRARTRQGQTTPTDAEAARVKFLEEVRHAICQHNITKVFNADQTGTQRRRSAK
ncbi:hypothetical protein PHYSODRAFT_489075 [Phytophthora sojae]|uniref:HTH CENPB-type domain-containing protein n=1 Tax=Phytophthora sojae (strain P6497) TaxID=1094619 RepID=G4ZAA5_PHYSP|nr:hypothetical protein PHYSODRAFT_489075 [Phytophthora sojae]EGZ21990.1 hypothetical protein PHYSODRAFT_489075 [Phytophthora sojae]|eukprot:XP_009524707.1 hypothetical protein PHYSODRAFT_489075 [Phytophthora sojae]